MDVVTLSRWQFAITTIYHFLFIPLTLGLTIFIALLETCYVKTDNRRCLELTHFWGKIFLVTFAMGVVTGIVQEFHFGMNWSEYSRFMGDIFGAPLALEALSAFFLESIFLGVWIFSWDKLPKKIHCLTIWLVAFASSLSSYWILVANSFMQHPVGFIINNGRAEMTDFVALLTNSYVFGQLSHTIFSGIVTSGILIVSVSAYQLLKQKHLETFRISLKAGIIYSLLGLVAVMGTGHLQAQYIGKAQPMKLASVEALWETQDPAPFTVYADINTKTQTNSSNIEIPNVLSFLVYNEPKGEIKGIKPLQAAAEKQYGPGNYIPDVTGLFWSFRIMILAGLIMTGLMIIGGFLTFKDKIESCPFLLKALIVILPLPFISNSTGWYITEGGRQPWMVVGLQKVANAVSQNITPTEVWISLIGFTLVYFALAIATIYIIVKFIKKGPEVPKERSAI